MRGQKSKLRRSGGFTIPEMLVASTISVLVMGVLMMFLMSSLRDRRMIDASIDAANDSDLALNYMAYGVRGSLGLRSAIATSVNIQRFDDGGWELSYSVPSDTAQTNSFIYLPESRTLQFEPGGARVASNVESCTLSADPGSNLSVDITVEVKDGNQTMRRTSSTQIFYRN